MFVAEMIRIDDAASLWLRHVAGGCSHPFCVRAQSAWCLCCASLLCV